jgi:hypothetical protein
MTTSRLQLYQIAARAVGERSVDSLTESSETRRLLDEVWSQGNGAVRYWLEQGYWDFATRAVKLDPSSDVTMDFGYSEAFEKPSDFVRLDMISADERFSYPLTDFEIEGNYIFADVDPLYLRFISDDADFGGDFSKWPETFTMWAGHDLGYRALSSRLKNDTDDERLQKKVKRLLVDARSKDAQQAPPRFPPPSSWEQARYGRRGSERGKRGRLIG